jgi:hypothetical protein
VIRFPNAAHSNVRSDVTPQRVKVDSGINQDPYRQALPFEEQTKQDVTVGDVLVMQPHLLPHGQLQDPVGQPR